MGKERTFKAVKKPRTSGFIHIGEIIPGVLKDIEGRIKKNTEREKRGEDRKSNRRNEGLISDLRVK